MDLRATLLGTPREWAVNLTTATAIGIFLGVIGPFGSFYIGPLAVRLPFWIANLWIGFAVVSLVVRLALWVAARLDVPVWFALAGGSVIGSAPLGLVLTAFYTLLGRGVHVHTGPFLSWYGQTLVITAPCAFGYYYLGQPRRRANTPSGAGPEPSPIPGPTPAIGGASVRQGMARDERFLDRLPPRLGQDLLCLQMEDHYVRAHTAKGSDLILTPLKQAIEELNDPSGLQVHRSWWVRRAAVDTPLFLGRRVFLRLVNGLEVPVSRGAVARLRAAGWLQDAPVAISPSEGKIDAPA